MWDRIFSPDPARNMQQRLVAYSPDPILWKEVSAYLIKGRRPAQPAAQAALRGYLDLKDHLGGRAAFFVGAELSTRALEAPCREFLAGRPRPTGLEDASAWARFCLAADYLLILACQVRAHKGKQRRLELQRLEQRFIEVADDYLETLTRESAPRAACAPPVASARAKAA